MTAECSLFTLTKENAEMKVSKISRECGIGTCPAVFQISPECVIGSCPTVFSADGDLIIVGSVLTAEELKAIAHKFKPGEEVAVRVPKSLISGLKF